jgi:hypothetical protein
VLAPAAVSVAVWPEHIDGLLTVTVGLGRTVITFVAVPTQPFEAVPDTVYVVVVAGEKTLGLPAPYMAQVYDCAPLAVSVVVFPLHIVLAEAVIVTVGLGKTVIVFIAVPEHPDVVPVTVYVVVDAGVTVFAAPDPSEQHQL